MKKIVSESCRPLVHSVTVTGTSEELARQAEILRRLDEQFSEKSASESLERGAEVEGGRGSTTGVPPRQVDE